MLCNPSGETVDTLSKKAVTLATAIGFDSLTMFDYRPTGRSCKGIVAPQASTMIEDAESVLQWLIAVKGINISSVSIAGISLGGLQAIRLASMHKESPRLLLINTFASFSCILKTSASLIPGAIRIGVTGGYLPDVTGIVKSLTTPTVVVVSVDRDERISSDCTEELLTALRSSGSSRLLHAIIKGSHSNPEVDHNSLEMIREFLQLSEPLIS